MKVNGEAIYATHASPIGLLPWGRCTKKEIKGNSVLYFSVFDWPKDGQLVIPGLDKKAISATLLADGTSLDTSSTPAGLVIMVPEKSPDAIASVIKVTIKGLVSPVKTVETKKMKTGALD
jgi:alpha-L-fucosidase